MYEIIDYYMKNGGVVNVAIFLIAVITIYIGTGKVYQFYLIRRDTSSLILNRSEKKEYYFNFFTSYISYNPKRSLTYYKNIYKEILLEKVPLIEKNLDTMASLTSAAPLLGLLGTVIGMIKTFTLITTYGASNPVILTKGITVSLLTTQAGLLVAFPSLLFHSYLCNRKNELIEEIIKQGELLLLTQSFEERGD